MGVSVGLSPPLAYPSHSEEDEDEQREDDSDGGVNLMEEGWAHLVLSSLHSSSQEARRAMTETPSTTTIFRIITARHSPSPKYNPQRIGFICLILSAICFPAFLPIPLGGDHPETSGGGIELGLEAGQARPNSRSVPRWIAG